MNWLITGGCGFIGRSLIRHLKAKSDHKIRVYDNLSVGSREDLKQEGSIKDLDLSELNEMWDTDIAFFKGDILDGASISKACSGADVVVHLAANTGVAPSVEDPFSDCHTNVIGTLNVLEACRSQNSNRMVFASSGAPLGVQEPPLHENMAPHPASPYGASKLAGEGYCSAYFHCFGVETVALRFGNVYGPGSTKKASVVAKFIKQAMDGDTLEIYGNGSQTRDFIYIEDLVKAVYQAATVEGIGGEAFQIATSTETTVGSLTEKLISVLFDEAGIDTSRINGETRAGDVARNYSDTTKARERLNWTANVNLEEGLRKTVQFFTETK